MRGVNKVIVEMYESGMSLPQVSSSTGIPVSTVRNWVKKAGVLRCRAAGVRLAAGQGRLGVHLLGKKRPPRDESWCRAISDGLKESWKGRANGVTRKPNGYLEVTVGEHKGRGHHRVIAEKMIGRKLMDTECVHHRDGNRSNNDPQNLEVMTFSEHASLHAKENVKRRERDSMGRFIR